MKNLLYALGIVGVTTLSGISYSQTNQNYNWPKQTILEDIKKDPTDSIEDFFYVPSINLYVAKQKTHLGKNWFDCHKELQSNGERMLTLSEFIELSKYLKLSNNPEHLKIYRDIAETKNFWRGEWLDADFKFKEGKWYVNYYHVLDSNGKLVPKKSEVLDKNTLNITSQEEFFELDLDDWLNSNHTIQGLPNKNVKKGRGYYFEPVSSNKSVARYGARLGSNWEGLGCNRDPSERNPDLGVRAVKEKK